MNTFIRSSIFDRWLTTLGDGKGYRIYFVRRESTVYVLLAGGDKSTQKRDIARALGMARDLKEARK